MKIKIHRGLEQVGGCITEISTKKSRVFIDFGQNLPGCGEITTPEEDREMVEKIINQNRKPSQAVFYTHGHEDHVGLFVYIPEDLPQYMSENTKELLFLKYDVLRYGAKLGLKSLQDKEISKGEEYNKALERLKEAEEKINLLDKMKVWKRTPNHTKPESIVIGDIKVTPFFNCHSIYDSHMFLIEADGKRIWHTGDYRSHGYKGKGLFPTLKTYATNIDVLITEGTMLSRNDKCIHEREVSKKMAYVMSAFKYVFVLASATDAERLASINKAAKTVNKELYIGSLLMRKTMAFFTQKESKLSRGLFSFSPIFFSEKSRRKAIRKGMVMVVGASQKEQVSTLLETLPTEETILIYSTWDGYYKDPKQIQLNPKYKDFRNMFTNVVDIHTSGHADRKTIMKVIETLSPTKTICIHKDADATL